MIVAVGIGMVVIVIVIVVMKVEQIGTGYTGRYTALTTSTARCLLVIMTSGPFTYLL